MATNLLGTSKKLMKALNSKGYKLTFTNKQYMGRDGKPHGYYTINKAIWNEEKNRYDHTALYSTASMVRIVMFLRDMWYEYNGWELPTDQALWNKVRKELQENKNG